MKDIWANPDNATASGAMVAFHDLVTKSIGNEWIVPERRNLYCVSQVLESFRTNANLDLGSPPADIVSSIMAKVPGLGHNAEPRC